MKHTSPITVYNIKNIISRKLALPYIFPYCIYDILTDKLNKNPILYLAIFMD